VRTHLSGNTYTQLDAVHMPSSFAKNCPLEVQFKKSPKIHFYRNIQKIIRKSLWGIKSEHHSKHVKSSSEVSELPLQVFDSFQCPSKKEVQYDQLSRSTSILADKSICKSFCRAVHLLTTWGVCVHVENKSSSNKVDAEKRSENDCNNLTREVHPLKYLMTRITTIWQEECTHLI
jgi:hypothetical protein